MPAKNGLGGSRRVFTVLLLLAVLLSGACSALEEPAPVLSGVGDELDRLPADAFAAILVAQPNPEYRNGSAADNSWLVVVDSEFEPLGYIHRAGLFRAAIEKTALGLVFADRQGVYAVDSESVDTTSLDGKAHGGPTARSVDGSAVLWTDSGVQGDGDDRHFGSVGVFQDSQGTLSRIEIPGRVLSTGFCGGTAYTAAGEFTTDIADGNFTLYSNSAGTPQPQAVAHWTGPTFGDSNFWPVSCGTDGAAAILFDYPTGAAEGSVREMYFWQEQRGELTHTDLDPNINLPSPATSSGSSWSEPGGNVGFVTREGSVVSADVRQLDSGVTSEPLLVLPAGESVLAADTSVPSRALLAVGGSGTTSLVQLDIASRREVSRSTPGWLTDLLDGPYSVTDVQLLSTG
ncbi:hypothetical protein GIY30_23805 [Gordonia sp. HNM0687]|uniref:Uncharacterized protein n=1 Tax=Gordonia mangrovi TaxID=2665643 RepID=A0A6L7GYG5_9ACTN|nr:hypothetical protein [Gordonia mangrovi]MXP24351.1 hypothetical protein [Gordonia mangrovi]UVF80028.1 hypothetical protein NWF22_09480 [Gordonia mangrovi]